MVFTAVRGGCRWPAGGSEDRSKTRRLPGHLGQTVHSTQQANDGSHPRLGDRPSIRPGQASRAQHCRVRPGTREPPEAAGAGNRLRIPQKGELRRLGLFPSNVLTSVPARHVQNEEHGPYRDDKTMRQRCGSQSWPTAHSPGLELAKLDSRQLPAQRQRLHLKQKRENCLNASILVIEAIARHFTCQLLTA